MISATTARGRLWSLSTAWFGWRTGMRPSGAVLWSALIVCFLLVSCAPETTYVAPQITLSKTYRGAPHAMSQDAGRWELGFSDPVLDDLLAAALADNTSLATARARLRAAEAQARAAGVVVTGRGTADGRFNSNSPNTGDIGLGGVFDPAQPANSRAANARADAARFNEADARRLLLEEVAATYIEMRFQQQLLQFQRTDTASRRRTLEEIEIRVNGGVGTEVDLVSAEALLREAQSRLPGIEAAAISQQNRLSTLVGKPVGSLDVDLSFTGHQPLPQGRADMGVPADLLRARPDIRRIERLYAASIADIDAARADFYPSLNLTGLIRVPLTGEAATSSVITGLTLPVVGREQIRAGVDVAEADATAAFEEWRGAVLEAVEDVETALAQRSAAERAETISEDVVGLQSRSLELSRRLLDEGGGITSLDLLNRERAVSQARSQLATDRRDIAFSHITLRAALGLDQMVAETPVGQ